MSHFHYTIIVAKTINNNNSIAMSRDNFEIIYFLNALSIFLFSACVLENYSCMLTGICQHLLYLLKV